MGMIGSAILGAAGASYGMRKSNKYSSQAFNQRMQDAEKYGIHPLQALGGAGTFMGTGGANIGSQIQSEMNSRRMQKAQARQDYKEYTNREDQQDHELQMQELKNAAEDRRLSRQLEEKKLDAQWRKDYPSLNRSIYNWFFPPGEQEQVEFDNAMGNQYQSRDLRINQRRR